MNNQFHLLSELVERHYQLVYRYTYRLTGSVADAEDLTQQTFLKVQDKIGQLRDPASAKAWLCKIARNFYLKNVRHEKGARFYSLEAVPEPQEELPVHEQIDQVEFQQILNEIPEDFRTPLILYYFEEFNYREIAEQLNIPLGTVMSRLSRGKTYLRQRLVQFLSLTTK